MPYLVRPSREEMQYLKKLHKGKNYTEDMLSKLYECRIGKEDERNMYWLVYCTGCEDFVGECAIWENEDRHEVLLYIQPSLRRSGYGTAVLEMLQKEAADRGIKTLYIHAPEDEETLRFVRGRGFQPVDEQIWKIDWEEKETQQGSGR